MLTIIQRKNISKFCRQKGKSHSYWLNFSESAFEKAARLQESQNMSEVDYYNALGKLGSYKLRELAHDMFKDIK